MSVTPPAPPPPGFPMNVLDELAVAFGTHMPNHTVIQRPLRYSDPNQSIGLYAVDTNPLQEAMVIGQQEPILNRYNYRIQNLVKHSAEITGKSWFTLDAKTIRAVLYRDNALTLRLAALVEEVLGTREVAKQWGVSRQRFLSNELQSQFIYLAQTDFWLETESIEL